MLANILLCGPKMENVHFYIYPWSIFTSLHRSYFYFPYSRGSQIMIFEASEDDLPDCYIGILTGDIFEASINFAYLEMNVLRYLLKLPFSFVNIKRKIIKNNFMASSAYHIE